MCSVLTSSADSISCVTGRAAELNSTHSFIFIRSLIHLFCKLINRRREDEENGDGVRRRESSRDFLSFSGGTRRLVSNSPFSFLLSKRLKTVLKT